MVPLHLLLLFNLSFCRIHVTFFHINHHRILHQLLLNHLDNLRHLPQDHLGGSHPQIILVDIALAFLLNRHLLFEVHPLQVYIFVFLLIVVVIWVITVFTVDEL